MEKWLEKFMALGVGEKIIVIAGLILFIDGFLPWYDVDLGIVSVTRSGWESPGAFWSILAILLGIAMSGVIAGKALTEGVIPDNVGGVTWPKILLGGGVATALLVLIKLLNESSYLGFGFYIGIICAPPLALGGVLLYRQEIASPAQQPGVPARPRP